MIKFVIIAEARCGYQFLASLLRSHPDVMCFGEVFGRKHEVRKSSLFGEDLPVSEEKDSAIKYLESQLVSHAVRNNKKVIGFKLNHNDCVEIENWKSLWNYLVEEKWKVIHLQRKNLLDRALSEKLAIKDWNWNLKIYDSGVRITFDELEYYHNRSVERKNQIYKKFAKNEMLDVFYEELNEKTKSTCATVQSFLNIDTKTLSSTMKKQRIGGQATFIINYRHLYHRCIKHPIYKKWLTDIPII